MKGLGRGKKCPQHNIVDLSPGIPTPRQMKHSRWMDLNTHTHTHTRARGKQVILTTGEVTTEAALAVLSYGDSDGGKALVQAAKLIFKICLIMKTNLNSILTGILKKIPSQ